MCNYYYVIGSKDQNGFPFCLSLVAREPGQRDQLAGAAP
jgi:hypothetical protein